jgi:DNA-binding transcriptional MerR regulator
MSGRYTISQLAHVAAVPTTTVRYYERIGLLQPEVRSVGNYRLYSNESLRKLKFIRAAQGIGFKLDDVRALLGAQDSRVPSCDDVQGLIEDRLADIDARLRGLREVKEVLTTSLAMCRKTVQSGCCHVIETLRETAK